MATKKPAPRSKPKKKNPVPVVARNPSSPLERSIADGMARAFHVSAWADREEELGRLRGGQELMDVAPPTTEEAKQEAWKLIGSMETANGMNLPAIFAQALIADGKTTKDLPEGWVSVAEDNAEEFGHYMAMQSLGHGVSWFDDHKEFTIPQVSGRGKKFVVPHTEFHYFDPSEYGGEPEREENPLEEGARFAGGGSATSHGGSASLRGGSAAPRGGGGFADNPHPQNDETPRPQPSAPRRAYEDNPPPPYHHPDPQHERAPRHRHIAGDRHDNPRHPYEGNAPHRPYDRNPRAESPMRRPYDDNPRSSMQYEENHRTAAEGAWSRPEHYEFSEGTSNKFWEIQIGDRRVRTFFGRIGHTGQVWTSPKFRSEEEAGAEYDRLVREKTRKGYQKTRGRSYDDNPVRGERGEGRGVSRRNYDENPRTPMRRPHDATRPR